MRNLILIFGDQLNVDASALDYLIRHQNRLSSNQRMRLQFKNLDRLNSGERSAVARAANELRKAPAGDWESPNHG